MKNPKLPNIKKFPAAKQRRLDSLLAKNSSGSLTTREQQRLHALVADAEALMVTNAKCLPILQRGKHQPPLRKPCP